LTAGEAGEEIAALVADRGHEGVVIVRRRLVAVDPLEAEMFWSLRSIESSDRWTIVFSRRRFSALFYATRALSQASIRKIARDHGGDFVIRPRLSPATPSAYPSSFRAPQPLSVPDNFPCAAWVSRTRKTPPAFSRCPLSSSFGECTLAGAVHTSTRLTSSDRDCMKFTWSMQKSARTVAPAYQEFYIDRYE
jgi:hypothetical protein